MSTRASDNSGRVKNFICQSFEDHCCAWPHLTSCSPAHSRIHPRPSSLNVCLLPSSESATGPVYGKDSSTPEKAPWNFEAGKRGRFNLPLFRVLSESLSRSPFSLNFFQSLAHSFSRSRPILGCLLSLARQLISRLLAMFLCSVPKS